MREGAQRPPADTEQSRRSELPEVARLEASEITVTISGVAGQIKPLLGVNCGPLKPIRTQAADLTDAFRRIGVRAVRTHDYYGPMDMSRIFPDITADPRSPASYVFDDSDETVEAIVAAGAELYLRLGDSWNNVRIPGNERETANLAEAMAEVARRYDRLLRERGVKRGLQYAEIWNEPDMRRFWPGPMDRFYDLFALAAKALKRALPHVKVGGPAFVVATYKIPEHRRNITDFIREVRKRGVEPDFISWHLYSNDPVEYLEAARYYRRVMDQNGLAGKESHLTEWNTEGRPPLPALRTETLGAALLTAAWIGLQEAGVDRSFIYRANDPAADEPTWYGIFFFDGRPKPAANAFALWSEMAVHSERLAVKTGMEIIDGHVRPSGGNDGKPQPMSPLWLLAGRKPAGGETAVLAVNAGLQTFKLKIIPGAELRGGVSVVKMADRFGRRDAETLERPETELPPCSIALFRFAVAP